MICEPTSFDFQSMGTVAKFCQSFKVFPIFLTWCEHGVTFLLSLSWISRPDAPMNSEVAIVNSMWRHNCWHWLWVKELDLDPDRVPSETRSGSKPSLKSSFKSRLIVNMAPGSFFHRAISWHVVKHDKSTLVEVMAWCRQATSLYMNQCWPSFMWPYGVTTSQWVEVCPLVYDKAMP